MADYSPIEAQRILQRNLSPRYLQLEELERWVNGTQYDGRPSFWDTSRDVPLWERAPVLRSCIVRDAIADNTSLLLGEGRFPDITSRPGEDNSESEDGLDGDASSVLDALIDAIIRQTRFRSHSRTLLTHAQECGTAVGLYGFRCGRLFAETTKAKWCTPKWDSDDGSLTSLEIRYPYIDHTRTPDGKERAKVMLYRRLIDASADKTFKPIEADPNGREPKGTSWSVAEEIKHGFGFVPATWWKFGNEVSTVGCIDGRAIHHGLTGQLESLDFALSQRHRSAVYLEPQWTECGVSPDWNPTDPGRQPVAIPGADPRNPMRGGFVDGARGGNVRRKGPGNVWRYLDPATKVELHQANGDALRAISEHATDLESKIAQSLAVIFLDPSRIKFAGGLSGKALRLMKQRQIDRCSEIHDDWTENACLTSISMLLRIAMISAASLKLPALKKALPILAKFLDAEQKWQQPSLTVIRGPWFERDSDEEEATIRMVSQAKAEGLVSRVAAVQKVAPIFDVENPADMLEQIDEEAEEKRAQDAEDAAERSKNDIAVMAAAHKAAGAGDVTNDRQPPPAANTPRATGRGRNRPPPGRG